jgi:hypothetical protein
MFQEKPTERWRDEEGRERERERKSSGTMSAQILKKECVMQSLSIWAI